MYKKIILILLLLSLASPSFAAKGVVTYYRDGDYFIVETNMGYDLLEWYGGHDPSEGDIIVGNFESYGFKDIYDVTSDSSLRVWVEEYWLSKEAAFEEYYEHN